MQLTMDRPTTVTQVNAMHQSFLWMCIGLILTAFSSVFIAGSPALIATIYGNSLVFYGLIIAELALVFFLSLRITHLSFGAALLSFLVYAVLNGVTLASIFLVYTGTSIASTFFISALVFGVMAVYGYTTKRDLTTIGNLAFMGLIGIILASLVNFFLKNDTFSYVLSYLAVAIFIGLTAYDTQKIKQMAQNSESQNIGIIGALTLYLDFINIFLNLLRILGKRRND
jgi:FtsH-binding integral membrane protein